MTTERIITDEAPRNDNPYSQGIQAGNTLYISGYGPVDSETGNTVEGGPQIQTEQVLENIENTVVAAGGSFADLVKVTVYLTDLNEYDVVNEAYGAQFSSAPPARVCVEVSRLPDDVNVEMDAIAYLGDT
jgi:2-iminobutanoate/2-iminopropanoate deaminase